MNRKYHWVRDYKDNRDLYYKSNLPILSIPDSIDLTRFCSSIENQFDLGSCTANAIVSILEYLENKTGWELHHTDFKYIDLSRLFIYYVEREYENTISTDSGAMIRDGIKACNKVGVCTEELWPYNTFKFAVKPTKDCYEDASSRKIKSYKRIRSVNDMLVCLSEGFPFVIGISIFESFESKFVEKTGIVSMPKDDEKFLGGHAVACFGYDRVKRTFLMRNSWGSSWGNGGYFTVPFLYLESLGADSWVIYK